MRWFLNVFKSLNTPKLFFSSFGREPCPCYSWVPPAGSFLSRQEAPQECGLRRRCRQSRPPLGIPPGLRTNIISAPPSGEYGVQSLNFSRFDSMRKIKFLATFYLNILLPGYSMPVCALARNREPVLAFVDCFHRVKTAKRPD